MSSSRKIRSVMTLAVVVLLALGLGACDSDSPTAPSVTTPAPPASSGGASGSWSITVSIDPSSVSITDLLLGTDSARVTITARRNDGTTPPTNSTILVSTTGGTLSNSDQSASGTSIAIRFDSAGRAIAILSIPDVIGSYVVEAQLEQSFGRGTLQVTEEEFETPLFIEAVVPNSGPPAGGTTVRIEGSGFSRPLRVQFGGVNANILSSDSSVITVETPPLDLPVGQTATVPVTVTININDPDPEQIQASDTLANAFTYARGGQTGQPSIISLSPTSGPNEGGTLVTIVGENFADQVQVFFGTTALIEAPIIDVSSTRLLVETPSATGPNAVNQNAVVNVRVVNTVSGLFAERASAFQYGGPGNPVVFISAAGPGGGLYLGGTIATIFGQGFDEPVAVEFGGFGQQVVSVTGTEIVAQSVPIDIDNCTPVSGPFSVTNIETGEGATSGILFEYVPIEPAIFNVTPNEVLIDVNTRQIVPDGATTTISGSGFDTPIRVSFGTTAASIVPGSGVPDPAFDPRFEILSAVDVFIPPYLDEFDMGDCQDADGIDGMILRPTAVDVTVFNFPTDCEDTFTNSFIYVPVQDLAGTPVECEVPMDPPDPGDPGGDVPVADFSFVVNNLLVEFTDLSSNSPTAWQWDFGDGGMSSLQNPSHTYPPIAAAYNVTLIASNASGDSAPVTMQVTINPAAQ